MKENAVQGYMHPRFKEILAIEAAARGKSVIQFTTEMAMRPDPLKEIVEEWDKKWKKVERKRGFDFP